MLISFRSKIFIFIIISILFTISVLGGILYKVSADTIKQQVSTSIINNLKNASINMETILKSINNLSANLSLNPELIKNLQMNIEPDCYEYYLLSRNTKRILEDIKNYNSDISSVYLYSTENKFFFMTNMNRTLTYKDIAEFDWLQKVNKWSENYWGVFKDESDFSNKNEYLITSIKSIKNEHMTRNVGYLSVNINYTTLKKYFGNISIGENGYIYILDSDSQLVFHPNKFLLENRLNVKDIGLDITKKQGYLIKDSNIGKVLISYIVSDYNKWVYVAQVPLEEILEPVEAVRFAVKVLFVLCLAISIFYSTIVSNKFFSPIKLLVEYMRRAAEGENDLIIKEKRNDEFGLLYKSFNEMIIKIKSLIHELYVQEILKKELQLKIVQSQLNPHFLYNTLDAIHWAAREKSYDEVCDMTFELSKYLRRNLSEGRDVVTVNEVAELTKSYIHLQKIRFEDKFEYEIKVDERIKSCNILKYLFQPIVENAIQHGIEKISNKGFINISWTYINDNLLNFTVEDNGYGIKPEKLKSIIDSLKDEEYRSKNNFALKNINLQIKLFYGREYGLEIFSEYGKGTRVSINIPTQIDKEGIEECIK